MTEPTKPDLTGLQYPALLSVMEEAKRDLDQAKAWVATIQNEIDGRLMASVKAQLEQLGKTTGTVNMPLQGGITAKGVVDKKVEWDSDKLFALAITMPVDQARAIFKFAVSVPEKNYEGIKVANPDLGKAIDAARTIKASTPKITLSREDA